MSTIGVVISAYNAAAFIDQALASVAAQTRGPDAVVVVDDGSTDDTAARARRWAPRLPIRVLQHESNRGLCAGRRTAIEGLETELVVLLDADDVWLPEH